MDRDVRAGVVRDAGVVADVVPVPMGRDDELQRPFARGKLLGDPLQARNGGVDRDRLTRPIVAQDVQVRRQDADDAMELGQGAWTSGDRASAASSFARMQSNA